MGLKKLFTWLEDIGKLGSRGQTSVEDVCGVVGKLEGRLCGAGDDPAAGTDDDTMYHTILQSMNHLYSCFDVAETIDVRIRCGCLVAAVVQEVVHQLQSAESTYTIAEGDGGSTRLPLNPPPPPNLLSLHQTRLVRDGVRFVLYTSVLGCLDAESALFIKMSLARHKFVCGPDLVVVPPPHQHFLLAACTRTLLSVIKDEAAGAGVRQSLFPEVLSVLLQLCFAPSEVKGHPEDTAFFRGQLEEVMTGTESSQILQHLLLLLGMVQSGVWLGRVCGSLVVRRFLLVEGGVARVLGAALALVDGQDWRRCEAVAVLVARAKTSHLPDFYASVGPQLWKLIQEEELKPDVVRVVGMVVAQLAERCAALTASHVTLPLLQPLRDVTLTDSSGSWDITLCINRIHKLFVEVVPPSPALASLLQPVLCPLLRVASLPTTHLRTQARHILVRYLTQLKCEEDVVEALLVLCGLQTSPASPPVDPSLAFTVDAEGGVTAERSTHNPRNKNTVLDEDENQAKCVIAILELLKNSTVVLKFYEALTSFIDFTELQQQTQVTPTTMLLTEEDVQAGQFEKMRKVVVSCSLLSELSENEPVVKDLFVNLSAAVPVVSSLLKAGCVRCEEEQLGQMQVSLVMNVLMLVCCYVSERTLRGRMLSEDWQGLKALLPPLEAVAEAVTDEAVLLFVEQLRSLVLTHGAVASRPHDKHTKSAVREVRKVDEPGETSKNVNKIRINNRLKIETAGKDDYDIQKENPGNSQLNEGVEKVERGVDKVTLDEEEVQVQEVNSEGVEKRSCYKEAMEELFSPLLPIRGHALLALGKLVDRRDPEALSHKEQLLSIFQHNLREDDSYLYLMAVEGLAVLCDAYPQKVVVVLTDEFSSGRRSPEDRAKLSESLTRATQRLGQMLPTYKDLFINAFLTGIRDPEAIVRAASLSGLGDVCKLLRFSLGPVVHEVFSVLYCVVKSERMVEVRRAAVLVVTLLLQGLGQDAFTVLQEVLRDLYRLLRLVQATDEDEVVRLHAQLALEEVDTIMRQFLLPRLTLTKKIYVTDIPPNPF